MNGTPKSLRLQIGVFGLRNAGKSSLLNRLSGQQISIVSSVPGTTTDPTEKAMELRPLGPVLLIDTAGLDDDQGMLGEMRVERSRKVMERTDLALIVSGTGNWSPLEFDTAEYFISRKTPVIAVFNKSDLAVPERSLLKQLEEKNIPSVSVSAENGAGFGELLEKIIRTAPEDFFAPACLLPEFMNDGSVSVLVTPVDIEAPKGRLILPQVQTIREILDRESWCIVTKENHLEDSLNRLSVPPDLVITDSQMFAKVSRLVPDTVPLTSFSILFARQKTDLSLCAAGAAVIDFLKDDDRVLIAEACTHHPTEEDIGRVKIPRMLRKKYGEAMSIDVVSGMDFPENVTAYDLIIQCGGCMFNRKYVMGRIERAKAQGVPMTNYGVAIAYLTGILDKVSYVK